MWHWNAGKAVIACALAWPALAETLILQSATSPRDSGWFDQVLPIAEQALELNIQVIAVGSGQALKNAQRCDGDLLLTHAPAAEIKFIESGFGQSRIALMNNPFVLIGPNDDPAEIRHSSSTQEALSKIHRRPHRFISRGDDSGTHAAELRLWQQAQLDPAPHSGEWYWQSGTGMGGVLNIAAETGAYALSDRASWIAFGRKQQHQILLENLPELANPYHWVTLNPEHCPEANHQAAKRLVKWFGTPAGQQAVESHRHQGQPLFTAPSLNTENK